MLSATDTIGKKASKCLVELLSRCLPVVRGLILLILSPCYLWRLSFLMGNHI